MKHLLNVHVGPVQEFIESARRCQDLWFGSWLLSDLSREVAKAIGGDSPQSVLIFPGAINDDQGGIANKILAILDLDANAVKERAEAGRKAMNQRLKVLTDEAFNRIPPKSRSSYLLEDQARRQLSALMEFFWVAVPFEGTSGDKNAAYAEARDEAEKLLAERKNTKNWGPVTWGAAVPKSSLDGLREAVLHEDIYNTNRLPEWRRISFGIKGQERLCGVALLKRLGADLSAEHGRWTPKFHSTSHVASAPLRAKLHRQGAAGQTALARYLEAIRQAGVPLDRFSAPAGESAESKFAWLGAPEKVATTPSALGHDHKHLDGYLLFRSRAEDIASNRESDESALIEKATSAIQKALSEAKFGEPNPYYAVLLADGDNMGVALNEAARSGGLEAHRKISGKLADFAASCRKVVADYGGSLIYAGGDDVLALVPLHTVLGLARRLHDDFAKNAADAFGEYKPEVIPTLSVGVAIVHHLEPMSEARALAKEAEKKAKSLKNKDALAIGVSKRSGGTIWYAARWDTKPDNQLEEWVRLFEAGVLPQKAAHDLARAMAPLSIVKPSKDIVKPGKAMEDKEELSKIAASLAKRVISRKHIKAPAAVGGSESPDELVKRARELVERARESLSRRFQAPAGTEAKDVREVVAQLSDELLVANALLPAYRQAYGREES